VNRESLLRETMRQNITSLRDERDAARAERDALAERVERLENLLDDLVNQAEAAGMTVTAKFNAELREGR
jgi:polyhydroxyalkanoate synthesis regulator phasin